MLIREVMTTPAVTVTTQSSTGTALWLMQEEQITSIPVVDYRGALIGAVNETDVARDRALIADRVPVLAGRVSGTTLSRRVGEAMEVPIKGDGSTSHEKDVVEGKVAVTGGQRDCGGIWRSSP